MTISFTHALMKVNTHTRTHTHTKHHQQMLVIKDVVPGVCGLWVLSLRHPDQRHLVTHGLLPVGAGDALPHRAGGQPHHQGLAGTSLCTPSHHTPTFSADGLCLWVQVSKLGAGGIFPDRRHHYDYCCCCSFCPSVQLQVPFGVDGWLAGVLIVSLWVSDGTLIVKSEL